MRTPLVLAWDTDMQKNEKDTLLEVARVSTKKDAKKWVDLTETTRKKLYEARYGQEAAALIIKAGGEIVNPKKE